VHNSPRTQITKEGSKRKLKFEWTGIRPILIEKDIKVLAISKCPISRPYRIVRANWVSRISNWMHSINLGAGNLSLGLEVEKSDGYANLLWNKRAANGWFKNFDKNKRNTGFFRIWDYAPAALSDSQISDLDNLIISLSKK
jgi:hypothetical protein